MLIPPTVADILPTNSSAAPTFSTFLTALQRAELSEHRKGAGALYGPGPFTVFAPSDAAFHNTLTAKSLMPLPKFFAYPNLQRILKHHVILGRVLGSANLTNGLVLPETLAGNSAGSLTVNVDGGIIKIATERDFISRIVGGSGTPVGERINGVVHFVDAVIDPLPTIIDAAYSAGTFGTFLSASSKIPAILELLNGANSTKITVFAPTDAAFSSYLAANSLTAAQFFESPKLKTILEYHILVGERMLSASLSSTRAGSHQTLYGPSLNVTLVSGGALKVNSASVTSQDVVVGSGPAATNGVLHGIDSVLLPAPTIVDVLTTWGAASFGIFLSALAKVGLDSVLHARGPWTLFAPTDAAFAKYLSSQNLNPQLLLLHPQLNDLLKYHILPARVETSSLPNGQSVDTLLSTVRGGGGGGRVSVRIDFTGVYVGAGGAARVITADLIASNGIMHVIDTVLSPPDVIGVLNWSHGTGLIIM